MRISGLNREDVFRRFLFIEGPGLYHQGSTGDSKVMQKPEKDIKMDKKGTPLIGRSKPLPSSPPTNNQSTPRRQASAPSSVHRRTSDLLPRQTSRRLRSGSGDKPVGN
ncbi:hypothetical protein U1Q18_024899 [Sarracenia purpurea var. burkii]